MFSAVVQKRQIASLTVMTQLRSYLPGGLPGKVFVGIDTGGVAFGRPYRGAFMALDAETGEPIWRFEVIDA